VIWDWAFAWQILPVLAKAAIVTVQATLVGYALALVVGLVLALLRRSPVALISWPVIFLIEFVRSTPLLVQIYFLFFGLPQFGIELSPFATGALALGIHFGTYTSEVYRSGIDGVPAGQWEAAKALNFTTFRKYWTIILPQAVPPIVPVLGNYLVAMFKDTTLLAAIAVLEMLQVAKMIGSETFKYMEPLTIVGVFFILISVASSGVIRWTERRLNVERSPR